MATLAVSNVRRAYGITPEIYFSKAIDNSRLVKVADPQRKREMALLLAALGLLLGLLLLFCGQHYSAIEYGYRNETLRQQRDQLLEARRQLQLDEAQLKEPWRIDELAHQLGLQPPTAGQVVSLDASAPDPGVVAIARATAVSVISATQ
jgi:cell division protein FtsL